MFTKAISFLLLTILFIFTTISLGDDQNEATAKQTVDDSEPQLVLESGTISVNTDPTITIQAGTSLTDDNTATSLVSSQVEFSEIDGATVEQTEPLPHSTTQQLDHDLQSSSVKESVSISYVEETEDAGPTPSPLGTVSTATQEISSVSGEKSHMEATGPDVSSSISEKEVSVQPSSSSDQEHRDVTTSRTPPGGETVNAGEATQDPAAPAIEKGEATVPENLHDETLQDIKAFIKETAESRSETVDQTPTDVPIKKEEAELLIEEAKVQPPDGAVGETDEAHEPQVKLPEIRQLATSGQDEAVAKELSSDGGEKTEVGGSDSGETTGGDQEEFPSFGEWTAKVLAEEEEKTKKEQESLGNMPGGAVQQKPAKQNRNNYASRECGAKILAANPEAQNTRAILNGNKDDYMTNPCTAKKWFTVELCEPIQVRKFELASFELFSSQPRTFKIYLSDRYPAKDWRLVGTFLATEERASQPFTVEEEHFSKFVKVEMVDHFREEHFCPLTLFRVYGVDLNDMTDDDDNTNEVRTSHDPDSGDLMVTQEEDGDGEGEITTNLFESAKDTVISLVKKVLKVEETEETTRSPENTSDTGNVTETVSVQDNQTEGGYPLPCLPDVQIPVGNQTNLTENGEKSNSMPFPETPYPRTTTSSTEDPEDNLVIKLEDHEQPPYEVPSVNPLTALISGKFVFDVRNPEFGESCFVCNNNTSEGQTKCWYIFLMLKTHRVYQSCPRKVTVNKTREMDEEYTEDPEYVEGSQSNGKPVENKNLKDGATVTHATEDKTKVSAGEGENAMEGGDTSSEMVDLSSSVEQDFVLVKSTASVPEQSATIASSDTETEQGQITSADDASGNIPQDIPNTTEEDAVSSSTASVVEPSPVVSEESETVTYLPLPADAFIPPSTSDLPSNQDISNGVTDQVKDEKSIELEPSYKNSLPVVSEKIPVDDLSAAATTTPELPPLSEGTVVSLTPPGEVNQKEGDITVNEQVSEELQDKQKTSPPADILVQPTQVEDSPVAAQDEKLVKAVNVTEEKTGNGVKNDLNLVRVSVSPHMKRETAIMRLSNRLKSLEVNVSLSSRFLEELSKRYRKQSDEVMKLLNKTISKLNNTTKMVEDKDEASRQRIGVLEARIENLTDIVTQLTYDMSSLNQKLSDRNFTWATMEVLIVCVLLLMSWRRRESQYVSPELQKLLQKMPTGPGPPTPQRRRNSSTGTVGHSAPQLPLVKHSSDSALDVQAEFNIIEPITTVGADFKIEGSKKKKKKKHKNLEPKSLVDCSKTSLPPVNSSTNQQSSWPVVAGFNGPWEELRMIDSCPVIKPRSNSHSGPTDSIHSVEALVIPSSDRIPSGIDEIGTKGSNSSIPNVKAERLNSDSKVPVVSSQSARFSTSKHLPLRISKSLNNKALLNSNVNRNATSGPKKPGKEGYWSHHRAQSDGGVPVDPSLSAVTNGAKQRHKDLSKEGPLGRPPIPGRQSLQQHHSHPSHRNRHTAPETLNATATNSAKLVTQPAVNQSEKGRKWSLDFKSISIK